MFGESPSYAAIKAAEKFKEKNVKNIIELVAGQGSDTLFFAMAAIGFGGFLHHF